MSLLLDQLLLRDQHLLTDQLLMLHPDQRLPTGHLLLIRSKDPPLFTNKVTDNYINSKSDLLHNTKDQHLISKMLRKFQSRYKIQSLKSIEPQQINLVKSMLLI